MTVDDMSKNGNVTLPVLQGIWNSRTVRSVSLVPINHFIFEICNNITQETKDQHDICLTSDAGYRGWFSTWPKQCHTGVKCRQGKH